MPHKQNALVVACSIAMLLLLGLYILDLNNAFARSSTLDTRQSHTQAMYRHPMVAYEKLTALGANQLRADYPLEHYQAQPSSQMITPPSTSLSLPITDEFGDIPLLAMPPQFAPFNHKNGHYTSQHPTQLSDRKLQEQQQQRHPALLDARLPPRGPPPLPPSPPPSQPLPLATPSPHNKQQEKKLVQQSNIQQMLQPIPISKSQQQQQQQPLTVASQQLGASTTAATQAPINSTQAPITNSVSLPLFYSEDSEHPVKDIMRAIENFSVDRPLEQLFPQSLVQLHLSSAALDNRLSSQATSYRQVLLDSLQPSISVLIKQQQQQVHPNQQHSQINSLFPSSSFESLCRSTAYITHPKKAKSLTGQWKTIVNLPGHKYRGVAISQMVRIEECSSQTTECVVTMPLSQQQQQQQQQQQSQQTQYQPSYLPRSQCLQQYGNQQLVAWTPQLGLHIDIFRFPNACSCHIKRI